MAQGDVKLAYAAKATITCTLTSLANTTGGRECTVIDNTANKYRDALIRVKTNGSAAGNTGTLDVYVYAALGDTTYSDGATGTDAAFTVANRKNAKYLDSITLNGTTGVVAALRALSTAFGGGPIPDKWGLIFVNVSGAALSGTAGDHVVEYEGVYDTVAP